MPELKAIFFDIDGTIIHTEKDGHRVAFNKTFEEFGFKFRWDVDEYGELIRISGGKERMRHYFKERGMFQDLGDDELNELILTLHKRKTELFVSLIESGELGLRPGIRRLMTEAMGQGIILGICTTANERSAQAVVNTALQGINFDFVLAGDMVKKKKPDPEIYFKALEKSQLQPETCLVVEDSENGVLSAVQAGIPVLVTTNDYTEHEDFSKADMVVTSLGDPDGEKGELKSSRIELDHKGVVTIEMLKEYFRAM